MKIQTLLFSIIMLLFCSFVTGQQLEVTGVVTSSTDNLPVPGVNISVKGAEIGTQTDFDGKYAISVNSGDILVFSYVGLQSKEITITNQITLNVQLDEDLEQLEDVIVTALGIKKTRKSLTYAAQDINSDELQRVKQTNPINSLSGKVSGLVVNRSSSGAGGSVKVTLRGNSSLTNNQPLYVVDGVPLSNPSGGQPEETFGSVAGGNRDGGDVLSLINPDDIESLTVLKGASASALYGSAGLNGVILITTKKGRAGSFKVDVSSNLTVDDAAYYLELGDEAEANVQDFFNTGVTSINSVSASGGSENAQTYFSYSNTFSSGILPTNTLKQHTVNFRETAQFFEGRLTANANVLLSSQKVANRPINGIYYNPLPGVYNFNAPGQRLINFENNFETFNETRGLAEQSYYIEPSPELQNPYWNLNRNTRQDKNEKLLATMGLTFKVNDWLSLQTRGTYDRSQLNFDSQIAAGSKVGALAPPNGRYIFNEQEITQLYGDVILNISKQLGKISINGNLGAITTRTATEAFNGDSGVGAEAGGLRFANVFSVQNFRIDGGSTLSQSSLEKKVNSLFASTTFGFDEKVFIDVTARNDWSSTLPPEENSYFYPSVGVTGVLSEIFELGDQVNFGKVRASYAEVGKDLDANTLFADREIFIGTGAQDEDPLRPLGIVRPERQRSFEFGTEWQFLNGRFGFDVGYYNTSTIDQFFQIPVSVGSGSVTVGVNSGDVLNEGVEASLYIVPLRNDTFTWNANFNFASNKNTVEQISNPADGVTIDARRVSEPGTNSFGSYIEEGGSFGDIYGRVVETDDSGRPIGTFTNGELTSLLAVNEAIPGLPETFTKVGNANPDFSLGWNNSFTFKNINLDFLIDGKFGGETISLTEAIVEQQSNNTIREQENNPVAVVNQETGEVVNVSAQEYYGRAGGRNGLSGEYVYSATNIRLAELAIGYNFNLKDDSFFTRIRASLIGNNLFFFYKDAPHDPNVSLSTGNALQGVDIFGLPSTRSIGLNINVTF